MMPRPGTPEFEKYWHLMQDLGPGPHHYISLNRGPHEVARFNRQRRDFEEDAKELQKLCDYLNNLKGG